MDNKLYKLMNWPEIESVVYSECDHPEKILGMKSLNGGLLVQAFFPGAIDVSIVNLSTDKIYEMEEVDEEGFFATFINLKTEFPYEYIVTNKDGINERKPEIYKYIPVLWLNLKEKLIKGTFYDSYRYLGAHIQEKKGTLGTEFMVYAPNALRVSLVGDFNAWDGRVYQMCRLNDEGVFGIFIPGLLEGALYKFEVKLRNGLTYLKRDPFAFSVEKGENDASRIVKDPEWEVVKYKRKPCNKKIIFTEICLKDVAVNTFDVTKIFEKISDKLLAHNSNAVLFDDFSTCFDKIVTNNGVLSFYAVNPNVLRLTDLIKLIDLLHDKGIKVFSTFDLEGFIDDDNGLRGFDGTHLYEIDDNSFDGRLTFDCKKPYVRNFLISSVAYFSRVLSLDGYALKLSDKEFSNELNEVIGSLFSNICYIEKKAQSKEKSPCQSKRKKL